MAKNRILSVSVIEGEYHYLEIERKGGGIFAGQAQRASSLEALLGACRSADQVHINTTFPSTIYQHTTLPKVPRKHLAALVNQDAAEKIGAAGEVMVHYAPPTEISDGGVAKWRVAYAAVAADEVRELWEKFAPVRRKIRYIVPLPVAAAAMTTALGKPESDFLLVWVGESASLILIASPAGVVYMARTVPLGLARRRLQLAAPAAPVAPPSRPAAAEAPPAATVPEYGSAMAGRETESAAGSAPGSSLEMEASPEPRSDAGLDLALEIEGAGDDTPTLDLEPVAAPEPELTPDAMLAEDFLRALEREINMTITFFKQEFRQAPPPAAFVVGNRNLDRIIPDSPLASLFKEVAHNLDTSAFRGLTPEVAVEHLALVGNMFVDETFNFLPAQEVVKRKTAAWLNAAAAATILAVGGAALWANQLTLQRDDLLRQQASRVGQLQNLHNQAAELQAEINRLKPLEGWKQFHESVFVQQPAWNMFVSELSLLLDEHTVLTSFQVSAGSGASRDSRIQGHVRARDWEEGLAHFREFGRRLQASPLFEVRAVNYKPEAVQADPRMYEFQIDLRLLKGR